MYLLFLVILVCLFLGYSEGRFVDEYESIRKWLKHHGFRMDYRRKILLHTCSLIRGGSQKQYNHILIHRMYWKLHGIRKLNLNRNDTVKELNKLIENLGVYVEKQKNSDDFWI